MVQLVDADAERRLGQYVDAIGSMLGTKSRRQWFANDSLGLFGDGERKSIEPIAARACADPSKVPAMEARLGHFSMGGVRSVRQDLKSARGAKILTRSNISRPSRSQQRTGCGWVALRLRLLHTPA